MKDEKKQQCVICHKDITNELPKIDIYGNHYCKDCYIEKCKYELMNMRDTILINKELLKRELQFLEEQIQKQTLKDRIAELEEENGELKQHVAEVEKGIIKIAKERNKKDELASKFIDSYNDSLKQFVERLKEEATKSIMNSDGEIVYVDYDFVTTDDIDEILKEFINE